ncbi:MAG: hypothetical protein ACI9YM_001443 [Brevundimonas sp.]|jgi:hypothetical protein|uniref:hypothetical protein n=1 Tax=Brevundimonas sp. TaxID=1871086 RepID=UPI0039E66D1C
MPRLNVFPLHRRKLGAVVVMAATGLFLAQCDRKEPAPVAPAVPVPEAPVTVTPPALPSGTPPLTRTDILAAAARAASAYAAGETPSGKDPLVGRPFAVRMAFGCGGPLTVPPTPAAIDGLPRAIWGQDHRSIQLSLTPGDWLDSALIAGSGAEATWETVEGFWAPRPWLAVDGCPAVRRDPLQGGSTAPSPQTVGLAAVFATGSSRLAQRNGRAYRYTVRAEGDQPLTAPEGGYRLVLEGRVVGFPGGRAIRCRASGPDLRPVCIAAVQLDRVAFESADGEALGEWRKG